MLRLLAELLSLGVCSDAQPLITAVEQLAAAVPLNGRAAAATSSGPAWHGQVQAPVCFPWLQLAGPPCTPRGV